MPIYMDRHNIKGASQKAVADAHQKDLAMQDEFDVKLMTYWFDEARGSAFCLVDAPTEDAVQDLHAAAHGLVPHEIIEVDQKLVEGFLGRIEDPTVSGEDASSAFRAIMFTDLEGSTDMTTRLGDEKAVEMLRLHNTLTRESLKAHGGREVKHTGDGFMLSFASVADAVACSIALQNTFAANNRDNPEAEMHLRVGLSAGEPVEEGRDLFGAVVTLAARICAAAEPDKILAPQVVRELCMGKKLPFVELGEVTPKGFAKPVRLFEVDWMAA